MSLIKDISVRKCKVSVSCTYGVYCQVQGGRGHSLEISSLGRAWSWGLNDQPQLGDNTIGGNKSIPVSVAGTVKTFCQIATKEDHSHGIDKNGRIWSWGPSSLGRLGDGQTTINRRTPVSVAGTIKTFCKISAGRYYSLAIDKNGQVWSWGQNNTGQLGDNTIVDKCTPVSILGTTKTFCEIAASLSHTITIDKNGRVWAWGSNGFGQLGDNTTISKRTPVSILGTTKTFCKIALVGNNSLAIDKNGGVWGWGYNLSGQLGDNTTASKLTPVSILGAKKTFCKITGGDAGNERGHSLAIDKNGRVWAWGENGFGQLGDNTTAGKCTPVSILGTVKTFCEIGAGKTHSLAIDKNGQVWAWGYNISAQLGIGEVACKCTPVSILGATKTFCKITAGVNHGISIDKNGRVWSWGYNSVFAQLGDNTKNNKQTPVSILGVIKTFCQIAGANHSLAIDKNGRVWSWGNNSFGQLGDNTTNSQCTPVSILGAVKTFCKIAAGETHSFAIDKNGQVWSWGYNSFGQLGDNTIVAKCTPVSLLGATKTFCEIDGGYPHSLAIDKNGQVWTWGYNFYGQLGDNTTISKRTPVSILGAVKTFCKITGGYFHTAAIDKNGRVWSWGYNGWGQLGINNSVDRCTPVSLLGAAKTFCKITAGINHTIAIDKNGQVWAWGNNSFGQLGDNTVTQRNTPVSILGTLKTFCEIGGGSSYTYAIDKNGQVWAWGVNELGQLGNNLTWKQTPVRVCNI